jgi:protein SCO1/2
MKNTKIILVGISSFGLIVFALLMVVIFSKPASFRGATFGEPFPPAPEIDLIRSDGVRFRLSEQRGDIVLLFFGYTSCPDVCPTTTAELKVAVSKLDEKEASHVKVVLVTVDPERDTSERMQEYVNQFNESFIGLSGSMAELEEIWQGYGVFREVQNSGSAAGYLVDHTARVMLIDAAGNLRVSFGFDTPVEDIVHDIRLILKEKP